MKFSAKHRHARHRFKATVMGLRVPSLMSGAGEPGGSGSSGGSAKQGGTSHSNRTNTAGAAQTGDDESSEPEPESARWYRRLERAFGTNFASERPVPTSKAGDGRQPSKSAAGANRRRPHPEPATSVEGRRSQHPVLATGARAPGRC